MASINGPQVNVLKYTIAPPTRTFNKDEDLGSKNLVVSDELRRYGDKQIRTFVDKHKLDEGPKVIVA